MCADRAWGGRRKRWNNVAHNRWNPSLPTLALASPGCLGWTRWETRSKGLSFFFYLYNTIFFCICTLQFCAELGRCQPRSALTLKIDLIEKLNLYTLVTYSKYIMSLVLSFALENLIFNIWSWIWDPWDGVGDGCLPPRYGEKELIVHSNPNAPHDGLTGHIIHEAQTIPHIDPANNNNLSTKMKHFYL